MQDTLKIAGIQSDLIWESPERNREHFGAKIRGLSKDTDIVFLPEMFATAFTMTPDDVAESMKGKSVRWMKKLASELDLAIAGSLIILEDDAYLNRFVFVSPDEQIRTYDKRHTFTLAGEDKIYQRGQEKVIIDFKGWKICPMVCYDLRFPAWSRNLEDYDLLVYVANWPKPRIAAWDALLKARAIENMAYCIGVNRVGKDHYNHEYSGHSAIYDGLGEQLIAANENVEDIIQVKISKDHLNAIREQLKFLDDRDQFTVSL